MQLQAIIDSANIDGIKDTVVPIPQKMQELSLLDRLEPWMILILVLAALAALLLALWMIYKYVNKVHTDKMQRDFLLDAVKSQRLNNLMTLTGTRAPDEYYNPKYLEQQKIDIENQLKSAQKRLNELANKDERTKVETAELTQLQDTCRDYEYELNSFYATDKIEKLKSEWDEKMLDFNKKQAEFLEEAKSFAEAIVPKSLTISGLKITGSFFIELTAILSIIFGIIILGLVGVLKSAEIAPILAAIAGYVLGKTTTGLMPQGNNNTGEETVTMQKPQAQEGTEKK